MTTTQQAPVERDDLGQTAKDYEEIGREFYAKYNELVQEPWLNDFVCCDSPVEILDHLMQKIEEILARKQDLRQPQARLTEEDCMVFATVLGHLKRNPDWLAEYQYMDALYDRLTSAPAPVTREEIEQCIRSNVWVAVDETPCGIDEATDVIMSLLASRGLVKGA